MDDSKIMKTRPAASGLMLSEAMDRVVEFNSRSELVSYLQEHYYFWSPTDENITIKPYGFDKRNGWNTHLICVDGKAALFSDGAFK